MRSIYEIAVETWGGGPQLDMVIEECAELIQAVLKIRRAQRKLDRLLRIDDNGSRIGPASEIRAAEKALSKAKVNVAEESADVEIMLRQLHFIIPCDYEAALKGKIMDMKAKLIERGYIEVWDSVP